MNEHSFNSPEVRYDAMETARAIVQRANEGRGGAKPTCRSKPENDAEKQECKDAKKLSAWRGAMIGYGTAVCSDEVRDYLDAEMPGWRDKQYSNALAMPNARAIVLRAKEERGGARPAHKKNFKNGTEEQEYKDAGKLGCWRAALDGRGLSKCSDEVRDYLDAEMPGWRDIRTTQNLDARAMSMARAIVLRAEEERGGAKPSSRRTPNNAVEEQEHRDAHKLHTWRMALNGGGASRCSDDVREYLDEEMPGWRDTQNTQKITRNTQKCTQNTQKYTRNTQNRTRNTQNLAARSMQEANAIVQRAEEGRGGARPKCRRNPKNDAEKQECKDAQKLNSWRGASKCSGEMLEYLDVKIPGWRDTRDLGELAMREARSIVRRADEGRGGARPSCRVKPENDSEKQECKDAQKLNAWRMALNGRGASKCSDEVRDYLDSGMPGWREPRRVRASPSS